ncbi:Hemopexin [Aspergillus spinulosporus]
MVDAVFYHKGIQQAYFFGGRRYARIEFTPGSSGEKITFGPAAIADRWPSLRSIGFGTIDAILPIDGSQDEGYYFFGARFARIKLVPSSDDDTVVDGPWVITQKLGSLSKAGFDTIDTALPVPGAPGEAYIFRGVNYVRINVDQDRIVYGPAKLTAEWPGLTEAGFDSVDAAFAEPGNTNGTTYFFKGDQYVKIRVVANAPDTIVYGPKFIKDHWKTLDWI